MNLNIIKLVVANTQLEAIAFCPFDFVSSMCCYTSGEVCLSVCLSVSLTSSLHVFLSLFDSIHSKINIVNQNNIPRDRESLCIVPLLFHLAQYYKTDCRLEKSSITAELCECHS